MTGRYKTDFESVQSEYTIILSKEQFGFCKGRSCVTQLSNTIFDWLCHIDEDVPVDAIYLDFKKAFDSVPHERETFNKITWLRYKG